MHYEGINFNEEWVKAHSFKEFAEHEKHHGLSAEKMREIYDLCKGKKEAPARQVDAEPTP